MEAKEYAYEIVSQLGYGGKLDKRISTETAQQIIETALDNFAELRLSNVVERSEQLPCNHKQVVLVRHAAKCKDCGTVFETKW